MVVIGGMEAGVTATLTLLTVNSCGCNRVFGCVFWLNALKTYSCLGALLHFDLSIVACVSV